MTELRLTPLAHFTCLGKDCPDNCCSDPWDIRVDPPTLDRWRTVPDGDRLLENLVAETRRGEQVQLLRRNTEGRCVHLTPERLCGMQLALGPEILPDVCRTYPRVNIRTAGTEIASATLSCPEIARLVLRHPDGEPLFERRSSGAGAPSDPIPSHLAAVLDKVFDQTKFPLSVRLYYVGKALAHLATLSAQGNLDAARLREAERGCTQGLFDANVAVKNGGLAPAAAIAGSFWRAVYQFGITKDLFAGTAAVGSELHAVLDRGESQDAAAYATAYDRVKACRAASLSLLAPYTRALDNYLRVSLYNKGFPWNPVAGNYIASFMYAVIPFAVVKLILWSRVVAAGTVEWTDVENWVYKTERRLGHSTLIYSYFDKHPELLRLDHYVECLLDL